MLPILGHATKYFKNFDFIFFFSSIFLCRTGRYLQIFKNTYFKGPYGFKNLKLSCMIVQSDSWPICSILDKIHVSELWYVNVFLSASSMNSNKKIHGNSERTFFAAWGSRCLSEQNRHWCCNAAYSRSYLAYHWMTLPLLTGSRSSKFSFCSRRF